ncbi:hypothetical protein EGI11_04720 [Chryseobacterium sp. H3056]|uniref:Uncharacterized protein n=1 Tax=Kaistella daneshvariae TaxID=2487074 RepID=A0A3N0WY82_9FLAO|nr:hypothetical protein EGI11_04720 [Kaistella daneshvariae]
MRQFKFAEIFNVNKYIKIFFERVKEDNSTEEDYKNKVSKADVIFITPIKILLCLLLSIVIVTFLPIIVAVILPPLVEKLEYIKSL